MTEKRATMTLPQNVVDVINKISTESERRDLLFELMATEGLRCLDQMHHLETSLVKLTKLVNLIDAETESRKSCLDHKYLEKACEFMQATRLMYFEVALTAGGREGDVQLTTKLT